MHVPGRSLYGFLTTPPAPTGQSSGSSDDEAVPLSPTSIDEDVGNMSIGSNMAAKISSSVPDESWARGIFVDERQQVTDPGVAEELASEGPPGAATARATLAEATTTIFPASGIVGAFDAGAVPVATLARQPGAKEVDMIPGFGPGAGSRAVSIATCSCSGGSSSSSIGPVKADAGAKAGAAAASPPPPPPPSPPPAEGTTNRAIERADPLPLLPSAPSPSSPLAQQLNATTESNSSALGGEGAEDAGGVELLDALEVERIDALLGEGFLEGFGEELSGGEDMLPFFTETLNEG